MVRTLFGLAFAAVLGFGGSWAVDAKQDMSPTKIAMTKVNSKGGYAVIVNNELNSDKPDWDKIAKASKEITPLLEAMEKAPKKKAEKWKELTNAYTESAKALEKAAGAKDAEAAKKAFAGMTKCAACHQEYPSYAPNKLPKE